jgi:hypothetical protein
MPLFSSGVCSEWANDTFFSTQLNCNSERIPCPDLSGLQGYPISFAPFYPLCFLYNNEVLLFRGSYVNRTVSSQPPF